LVWGCLITASDVMLVLYLQTKGFRYIEAIVITLIAIIGSCFAAELLFSKPSVTGILSGFVPGPHIVTNQGMLYVSIGILGATVMPHNLYLHSSIVQTRKFEQTPVGRRQAIKFATIDSTFALMFALFINAAILILSAAVFHWSGHQNVAEIQDAYRLLSPLMRFTGERAKMGEFANRLWLQLLGWTTAGIIILLNVKLLLDTFLPDAALKSLYGFFHIPAPTQ